MNILLISDGDSKYGAAHSLLQLIQNLSLHEDVSSLTAVLSAPNKRYKDILIGTRCRCVFGHFQPFYQNKPRKKWKRPVKYAIRYVEYTFFNPFFIRFLEKEINLNSIDLIHSNSSRDDIGAIISERYNIPLVQHIREYGDKDFPCFSLRKNYIHFLNTHADKFIAVSDSVRQHWINKGMEDNKLITIYNGVETKTFMGNGVVNNNILTKDNDKTNNCEGSNQISCVLVGSINEAKGHREVIQAIRFLSETQGLKKYCDNVHVDFIGDGKKEFVKALKMEIERFRLSSFFSFEGYIDNPSNILVNYDIAFMCSRSEAFGRVTAEYMMAKLPVIASNTGANAELIRDNVDGILYPYGDYKALGKAIIRLISNKTERKKMGENGWNRAVTMFSEKSNTDSIISVYKDVLENRNNPKMGGV